MSGDRARPSQPWIARRWPSIGLLVVVLGLIAGSLLFLGGKLGAVLPEVGKDKQGEDPWQDPIGLEAVKGFQVGHIPDCAASAVSKIVLWNENSEPYWSVSGPPTPMTTFSVGVTPEGFTVETPYRTPPAGSTLRLVAFRRAGGPMGLRYSSDDLVERRVISGEPLRRFTVSGFQTADVCGSGDTGAETTTSLPG